MFVDSWSIHSEDCTVCERCGSVVPNEFKLEHEDFHRIIDQQGEINKKQITLNKRITNFLQQWVGE